MENGIPGELQHRHEMCCKKGGHYGRRAYDLEVTSLWGYISGRVDLHMTLFKSSKK